MSVSRSHQLASLPPLLVGVSSKMYWTHAQSMAYAKGLASTFPEPSRIVSLFFIPSFTAIAPSITHLSSTPHILVGAQDCHWEDRGPYTGEISATELGEIGCTFVELGHAERRAAPFNEDDAITAKKALAAFNAGLIPLVCIGERKQSKSGIASEGVGLALQEVVPQVKAILDALPDGADVVFAYEPVWAIGAATPAGSDHVTNVIREVKNIVGRSGRKGEIRFLYGGSAGPGTWDGLKGTVDGLFLGRFAHVIGNLEKVIQEVQHN